MKKSNIYGKLPLKTLSIVITSICLCVFLCCCGKNQNTTDINDNAAISFTDDEGNKIALDKPCEKIISLYSAHTENLFELGCGDKIIGASNTSIYPPKAAFITRYDYKADPEEVIAAQPDVVLIRPFITNKSPDFVSALKNAGITVVSLYPESFDEFDEYIKKLGQLVGKSDVAQEKLTQFHKDIESISSKVSDIENKKKMFFESTETNLKTVTKDSLVGKAINFAGGINVAENAKAVNDSSSIAAFGAENILALANEIDVYVSQRGAMNAGGNEHSISIRPGFDTIKAVKNGDVYLINEKIISSPTFRYYKGINELARFMYPDVMDSMDNLDKNAVATKKDFAEIVVKANHLPIYVPSSSKYYNNPPKGHVYGLFEDVSYEDEGFDYIETAVNFGAIDHTQKEDKDFFEPQNKVTREQLASAIFLLKDIDTENVNVSIKDIDKCKNSNIVSSVVASGIMTLENGNFNPTKEVTIGEIIDSFNK